MVVWEEEALSANDPVTATDKNTMNPRSRLQLLFIGIGNFMTTNNNVAVNGDGDDIYYGKDNI